MEAQESAVRWIEVRNGERRYSTVCGFEGMCPQKEERESRKEKMREWLSGGVSPCQGEGRGFESRLALVWKTGKSLEEHGVLWFFLYSYI